MSVHIAEKKGSTLKGSNGLIATAAESETDEDWQNGQNLLVVTQDGQGKELLLSENQTINVTVDTYCSYIFLTLLSGWITLSIGTDGSNERCEMAYLDDDDDDDDSLCSQKCLVYFIL